MQSKYEIGDTVILSGTVKRIEQMPNGDIFYYLKECDLPVREDSILGRLEVSWELVNRSKTRVCRFEKTE